MKLKELSGHLASIGVPLPTPKAAPPHPSGRRLSAAQVAWQRIDMALSRSAHGRAGAGRRKAQASDAIAAHASLSWPRLLAVHLLALASQACRPSHSYSRAGSCAASSACCPPRPAPAPAAAPAAPAAAPAFTARAHALRVHACPLRPRSPPLPVCAVDHKQSAHAQHSSVGRRP